VRRRCYFDLVSDREVIADHVGVEYVYALDVYHDALQALSDLRAEEDGSGDWAGWSLLLRDEGGAPMISIGL
jgi:hypothetical protein